MSKISRKGIIITAASLVLIVIITGLGVSILNNPVRKVIKYYSLGNKDAAIEVFQTKISSNTDQSTKEKQLEKLRTRLIVDSKEIYESYKAEKIDFEEADAKIKLASDIIGYDGIKEIQTQLSDLDNSRKVFSAGVSALKENKYLEALDNF